MRRFCPSRLRLLLVASLVTGLAVACGVLDSAPSPTPTPTANQSLGLEIAETYGRLMLHTRLIVDPRPPAPQVKEQLRGLGEEFKVQFANYACLLDTMSGAEQAEIAAAFDANRTRFLPADMSWFGDAESDYDFEDTAIRGYLEDIETLDDYAFLDRVAQSRPGEELLCG
jgi:hypothetical protein